VNKSNEVNAGLNGPNLELNPAHPAPDIAFRNNCTAQQELDKRGSDMSLRNTRSLDCESRMPILLDVSLRWQCKRCVLGIKLVTAIRRKARIAALIMMDLQTATDDSR